LLGSDERYLEVEVGPHGHFLVLALHGVRRVVRDDFEPVCRVARSDEFRSWRAELHLPAAWLPPGLSHINAYAIRGGGEARRYMAAFPVPGEQPDFHRLEHFVPIVGLPRISSVDDEDP
jgi:hypothetical protein